MGSLLVYDGSFNLKEYIDSCLWCRLGRILIDSCWHASQPDVSGRLYVDVTMLRQEQKEEQQQQEEQQAQETSKRQNINLLIKHQYECNANQSTEQSKYNTATIEPGCCIQPIQIPDSKRQKLP